MILLLVLQLLVSCLRVSEGQPPVPGVIIFGDSTVDVGNNNNLLTLVKANFPPYGRDFLDHSPTGRFSNGKLAIDLTIDYLGFTSYPPAYLDKEASGDDLLNGANFASASSGFLDSTATLYRAVSLTQQLRYYKEYQAKVERIAGKAKAAELFAGSIYVLSTGSSDFLQNYYINPLLRLVYSTDQFSDLLLLQSFTKFVQNLYSLGARRIGVTSLPPVGCLPASITLFGGLGRGCVGRLNDDAVAFNRKLNAAAEALKRSHQGLKLVVLDIYNPFLNIVHNPEDNGFVQVRKACCGTGTLETSLLCNAASLGTCSNATEYMFWDSFHLTEAANVILADALLLQGIELIS
ncbi:GDSL esterase/lipase At5g03810-like isoform X2 [Zingiber officinale]|uniref:GDSL esterase/lipase At5g03810-like isoform X2 n=1 Tax=Zingiber officinale TaxID=94328 RepID=UPI001C4B0B58|nr:GDSL esterase/lipase At5g03810-like isoform X2 [Zingiber officinale]